MPAVSAEIVCGVQPATIAAPSSGRGFSDHVTVTGVRYQPLQSRGAGEHAYWMSIAAPASAIPARGGSASNMSSTNRGASGPTDFLKAFPTT
jgi:hypothetical protein